MKAVFSYLLLCCLATLCSCLSINSYFTPANSNYAKKILLQAIEAKDVANVHFGILGLKLLGESIPESNKLCKLLLDASTAPNPTTETLYYVTTSYTALKNCPQPLPVMNIVKHLHSVMTENANMQELYYAVSGLAALRQKPQDAARLVKIMQAILKKNDSFPNLGYLFHIAAHLGPDGGFAYERIEDAVVQADEVDSKYLQYEGGLSITGEDMLEECFALITLCHYNENCAPPTALVVRGMYRLSAVLSKPVPLTSVQAVKFANYFLSRKSVQTPKGVWSLLEAFQTLTTNKYHFPVAVTLASSPSVSAENPKVVVKICDILGRPIDPMTVLADSATRISDNVVVLSKKKFEETSDRTLYSLNLMETKPEKGMYKLSISASLKNPDPRVAQNIGATITVKVMCEAAVDFLEVGTADSDQTTMPRLERVEYPKKLGKVIEVDAHQKVLMRFSIKDKSNNKLISVHQAFVRFHKPEKKKSAIFVAEHDAGLHYKFDLDVGAKASEFEHSSGLYDVELIVGDAVLSNSFTWKVATVKLSFPESKREAPQDLYKPKPEIKHTFREPEKRPAKFVSNLFSALVCAPVLLLLMLWGRLGVNVSNFTVSLSAVGFHVGLAAIFGLFGLFWLQLNMFQTIRYLIGIGFLTFLCGNKLLRKIAHAKK